MNNNLPPQHMLGGQLFKTVGRYDLVRLDSIDCQSKNFRQFSHEGITGYPADDQCRLFF